jgi:hypothetical protein
VAIIKNILPDILLPSTSESFDITGNIIEIPKCIIAFDRWTGEPVKETFGGKAIVSVNNKPMFAELGIMTHFFDEGWDARWVETYGRGNMEPKCLTIWKDDKYGNQEHKPIGNENIITLLSDIAKLNDGSYKGCWDVLAWKGDKVVFAESKRTKKDAIRTSQSNWLAAGLMLGLSEENFLVVQWDFSKQ